MLPKAGNCNRLLACPPASPPPRCPHTTQVYKADLVRRLRQGTLVRVPLDHGRLGFVQVVAGSPVVNGRTCRAGDGLLLDGESQVEVSGKGAEVLIFDLPRRP